MGVRAQFLFSRNCLFISVTGEEPAMLQNKWDAGSYSDSVATKRALSLKKLGAAVIEKLRGCHNRVRVERRIDIDKIDARHWKFFDPKSHFKLSPK